MELTDAQYERIAPLLPKPRGSLNIPHRQALNALHSAERWATGASSPLSSPPPLSLVIQR